MSRLPEQRALPPDIGGGPEHQRWVAELACWPAVISPPRRPPDDELAALGLSADDRADLTANWPAVAEDAVLRWLWDRCRSVLHDRIGRLPPLLDWPDLPAAFGAAGRWFFVCVHLSMADDIRRWHRGQGVPDAISTATLADLGAKVAAHRRMWGTGGLDRQNWLTLHFAGSIYRLGRLQFERSRVPGPFEAAGSVGRPGVGRPEPGQPALDVHIPGDGPLNQADCDESIRQAREFFPAVFPAEPYRVAICSSWLLDEQLDEYLPGSSNIAKFSRRFRRWEGSEDGDADVLEFVFGRTPGDLAGLPRDTTLQRAIQDHLAAGRHWYVRRGWFPLPGSDTDQ